jgi:hypothetical protein
MIDKECPAMAVPQGISSETVKGNRSMLEQYSFGA